MGHPDIISCSFMVFKKLINLIKDYLELYGNIVLAKMSSSPLRLDLIMYLLPSPGFNGLQSWNHTPSLNVGIA